jgi:hypothetical protein
MFRITIEDDSQRKYRAQFNNQGIFQEDEGFQRIIQLYNTIKQTNESTITRHELQKNNQNYMNFGTSTLQFSKGLPNISNSCYINSVLQVLKIIFDRFQIILNSSGQYSHSVMKLINSLIINKGVDIQDYKNFINQLRQENWARGDARDSKEFFTFLLGKLKSENNNSIDNLFTTTIEKQHKVTCSIRRIPETKKFQDSVTIITSDGRSISESINKKIDSTGFINDYPCSYCHNKERCEEKIIPLTKARINVLYIDPRMKIPATMYLNHPDVLCFITFTHGAVNHFKVHSRGKVFDDDKEYSENQLNNQFGYGLSYIQEFVYLIFVLTRN